MTAAYDGPHPLRIVLASPGLPHDGNTLAERSLGGSETAAIRVSRALARRGHRVTVFANCQPVVVDRVQWLPLDQFPAYACATPHHVTMISRATEMVRLPFASPVHILWCHDLALKQQRGIMAGSAWNLNAIYVLSDFMRRQYLLAHPGVPPEMLWQTRNGIDLEDFANLGDVQRDLHKLVYASRPERGLENAIAIMALLADRGSKLRLEVFGYDNTPPHLQGYYEHLWAQAKQLPNIVLRGPHKQRDWYHELASARALVYPGVQSEFREISCILVMEAMACGTPVVGCRRGAIPETLAADAGILLGDERTDVHALAYRVQFADTLERVATDNLGWRRMHDAGLEAAQSRSWDAVAAEWEADWYRRITALRTPHGMLRECARRGDRELLTHIGGS